MGRAGEAVALAVLAVSVVLGACGAPNYLQCAGSRPVGKVCNATLGWRERVDALVLGLSVDELAALITPDEAFGNTCDTHTRGAPRIGVGQYMWLTEANSNAAGRCSSPDRCPTTFVGPLTVAASFNRSGFELRGRVVATELRALRNIGVDRDVAPGEGVGITAFGPNINIIRDPRFGRTSELPSEDPLLSGEFGGHVVRGMQAPDAQGRPLTLAFLKHLAAYSMELNRGSSNSNISRFDLADTYTRQFRIASRIGRPAGAMCSYNAINGRPSCANSGLLDELFRKGFGQEDAIITSDCGAVSNLRGPPILAPSDVAAAAMALNNGTDLEMGSTLFSKLPDAVRAGLTSRAHLERAARRLYGALIRAGLFDTFGSSAHDRLGEADINSTWAQEAAYQAALQGPVLLRNDNGALPLSSAGSIAVVGPFGQARDQMYSDYAVSAPPCIQAQGTDPSKWKCIVTLVDALRDRLAGTDRAEAVTFAPGALQDGPVNQKLLDAGIAAATSADTVVLALGSGREQEHEGIDKATAELAAGQRALAEAVLALGKPTVVVFFNGNALSVDFLARPARAAPFETRMQERYLAAGPNAVAIVEAFNPNRDGTLALVDLLLGRANRWGKLPYTVYPSWFARAAKFDSFDMSLPPGRTYRYFSGEPLWPFGFGLSYTEFATDGCSCGPSGGRSQAELRVTCTVSNTGARAGDEVVQVYHVPGTRLREELASRGSPVPLKTLVAFERVSVAAGSKATVSLALNGSDLEMRDGSGASFLPSGEQTLFISLGSQGGSDLARAASCNVVFDGK